MRGVRGTAGALRELVRPIPPIGSRIVAANPLAVRSMGPNINRRTVQNMAEAGLRIERVEDLSVQGIFELIVARPTRH